MWVDGDVSRGDFSGGVARQIEAKAIVATDAISNIRRTVVIRLAESLIGSGQLPYSEAL